MIKVMCDRGASYYLLDEKLDIITYIGDTHIKSNPGRNQWGEYKYFKHSCKEINLKLIPEHIQNNLTNLEYIQLINK